MPKRTVLSLSSLFSLLFLAFTLLLPQSATFARDIQLLNGCTLVDAINAANTDTAVGMCPAGSGADVIILNETVTLMAVNNSTQGKNGLPSITSDITINGNGLEINRNTGSASFRIFHVAETGILSLRNINFFYGQLVSNDPEEGSGAWAFVDGGTLNFSNGTINNASAQVNGGGIFINGGTVNLYQINFSANSAGQAGGGIYNNGGTVNVRGSNVKGTAYGEAMLLDSLYNTATAAALIENTFISPLFNAGTLTINNSEVWSVENTGSAIINFSSFPKFSNQGPASGIINSGTVELNSSTLVHAPAADCTGTGTYTGSNNLDNTNTCPGVVNVLPATYPPLWDHLSPNGIWGGPAEPLTYLIPNTSSFAYNRIPNCGVDYDYRYIPRDANCDIGAFEFNGGTITGRVWNDLDGDGAREGIAIPGVDGVTITLNSGGTPIATRITANGGFYAFTSLAVGSYTLTITLPTGYLLTAKAVAQAADGSNSNANVATRTTDPISIDYTNAIIGKGADFGIYEPVSFSGFVFVDADSDGVYDPGESGIGSTEVRATRLNPSGTFFAVTSSTGYYSFNNLLPGVYTVTANTSVPYYVAGKMASSTTVERSSTREAQITDDIGLYSGNNVVYNVGFRDSRSTPIPPTPTPTITPIGYSLNTITDLEFLSALQTAAASSPLRIVLTLLTPNRLQLYVETAGTTGIVTVTPQQQAGGMVTFSFSSMTLLGGGSVSETFRSSVNTYLPAIIVDALDTLLNGRFATPYNVEQVFFEQNSLVVGLIVPP